MASTAPLMLCDINRITTPNIRAQMMHAIGSIDFQVYQQDRLSLTACVGQGMATITRQAEQIATLTTQVATLTSERDVALANAKKTKKAPAVKTTPKYIVNAGANAKAQRRLQGAGKLEPFRQGGCRCRTWGNGLGSQCHAKAKTNGMCAQHGKKTALTNGLWTMGFYDTDRPTKWGEQCGDHCHPVPGDRKAGKDIPWKMDDATFATAFVNMNELDAGGHVELDLEVVSGEDEIAPEQSIQMHNEDGEIVAVPFVLVVASFRFVHLHYV